MKFSQFTTRLFFKQINIQERKRKFHCYDSNLVEKVICKAKGMVWGSNRKNGGGGDGKEKKEYK